MKSASRNAADDSIAQKVMIFCDGGMSSANGLTAAAISGLQTSGITATVIFPLAWLAHPVAICLINSKDR